MHRGREVASERPKVSISAIVPVKDEQANIARCLQALRWCDEVFVVDSQSTDGTVEIAEAAGAKVVQFHFTGTYPKKKNWSLENLPFRNEWVLIVDADEVVTPELADQMLAAVEQTELDGFFVNRRFIFLGRWIRHCGYYPSWNLRLFKHALGRYERIDCPVPSTGDNEVHEHVVLDGQTGFMDNDMLHYAYPDIATWVEKHNRYSDWEAHVAPQLLAGSEQERFIGLRLRLKRRLKRLYLRLPCRFVLRFVYAFFFRLGFLDGRPGFIFCVLLAFYDFLSWAKGVQLSTSPQTEGPADTGV